jgi:hypothetical protein
MQNTYNRAESPGSAAGANAGALDGSVAPQPELASITTPRIAAKQRPCARLVVLAIA